MKIHPCCGFPLRNGSIVLAIMDIIGSTFGALSSIVTLIYVSHLRSNLASMPEEKREELIAQHHGLRKLLDTSGGSVIAIMSLALIACIVEFCLAILLLRGAKLKNEKYCTIWWRVKCALFVFGIAVVLYGMIASSERIDFAAGGIFGFIFQIYGLWVVGAFINELKFSENCEAKGIQRL